MAPKDHEAVTSTQRITTIYQITVQLYSKDQNIIQNARVKLQLVFSDTNSINSNRVNVRNLRPIFPYTLLTPFLKRRTTRDYQRSNGVGCCWAVSAVAAVEEITKLKTGKLVSLSEQQLVDCDTRNGNQGCNGGLMETAFDYIIKNQELASESNYSYKGRDGVCNKNLESARVAKITGYQQALSYSEISLMQAVSQLPVSTAVDAGGFGFQFYSSGVFTGHCGTNLNHAVTAVEYGCNAVGTKYWLVKNSWGSGWGEDGYMRMSRGGTSSWGLCVILMDSSYPTV